MYLLSCHRRNAANQPCDRGAGTGAGACRRGSAAGCAEAGVEHKPEAGGKHEQDHGAGLCGAGAGRHGHSGAIGTAGTPAPFTLTKAERSGSTAGSSSATMTYLLDGDTGKISPHVGHKVEITGVIQPMAAANAGGRSGSPSTGASSAASTLTLKVDDVKMLAATCTQ